MEGDRNLRLTDREIAQAFSDPDQAVRYPPILTLAQAAELAQVPLGTLRDWRSRGLLRGCARKAGRHVRVFRDRFVKTLFNIGIPGSHE